MSNESGFSWKYLIPGYGIYLIKKSEMQGKGKFIALNVVIILLILGLMSGGSEESTTASTDSSKEQATEQSTTAEEKTEDQKPAWKVGDTITTDKFEITINSVLNRKSVGGPYLNEKAAEGAHFVIVNFKYKNITKDPLTSFSMPEIKVIDPNGTEYDEAVGATGYYQTEINLDKKMVSSLNPGITQKDAVVFEVSKELWNSKGWKLAVDADDDFEVNIK